MTVALLALIVGVTGGDETGPSTVPGSSAANVPNATDTDTHNFIAPQMPWTWIGGGLGVPDGGAKYGPTSVTGQLGLGYARTPVGSLVAMLNIAGRSSAGSDWRPSAEQQLIGAGRETYIRLRSGVDDTPPALGYCQTAGYRFITWTPDDSQVEIASYCPGQGLQSMTQEVQWANGDWRMVMQPDGSSGVNPRQLPSLTGFTTWGTQ